MDEIEEQAEEFVPFYSSVDEWVEEWLLPSYSRPLDDPAVFRWDPQWWRYAEVVMRLEACWASWEKLRLEGGPGMVTFYRDYLDPMMQAILDPRGPFHVYRPKLDEPDGHREMPDPLPSQPVPPGLFRLPD